MFSKCSEFVRNTTTLFFCSELYLHLLAILENYATKRTSADAMCHQHEHRAALPLQLGQAWRSHTQGPGIACFAGLLLLEPHIPTRQSLLL